jgi:hypothetical protein
VTGSMSHSSLRPARGEHESDKWGQSVACIAAPWLAGSSFYHLHGDK